MAFRMRIHFRTYHTCYQYWKMGAYCVYSTIIMSIVLHLISFSIVIYNVDGIRHALSDWSKSHVLSENKTEKACSVVLPA